MNNYFLKHSITGYQF